MSQETHLKKTLGTADVFCVAAGSMISSGLFVLPAIAFSKAGPAMTLSYAIASLLILSSALSKAELTTAMPKAGGTYFYVERSLGPVGGLFSGAASWFSLALKSAFAIVGIAIILGILIEKLTGYKLNNFQFKAIAAVCCAFFTILNIVSVKHTTRLQVWLVTALLLILGIFIYMGTKVVQPIHFSGFMDKGFSTVLATSGLVFVSFGGLTKVASIAEEVKHPSRNLPRGMLLSWLVVSLLYIGVTIVTTGILTAEEFSSSYAPISLAAQKIGGTFGFIALTIAAMTAFITTANGGILAASRAPLAMSRDRLIPEKLSVIGKKFHTPHLSIMLTGGFMIAAIIFLDIESLVKIASTLMIILFILDNASVIIMRESKIQSYRPRFKSPLYPYMHIVTILVYTALLVDMGKLTLLATAAFIILSAAWFLLYSFRKTNRASAIMHIVQRVTAKDLKTVTLENELRDILIERDEIIADRFDELVKNCQVIDLQEKTDAETVFKDISRTLSHRLDENEFVLMEKFLHREAESSTVIEPGLAIPHIIVEGENKFDIVMVRAADGIVFSGNPTPVKTMFVLAGSKDQRNYHLRALMAIAQITQEKHFKHQWLTARGIEELRNIALLSRRKRDKNQ
ncbi:MAG: amino acid permease [Planctomycetes bacterium]|nr:amino acid permease [Planctomycetota bacterium]